MKKFAVLLIAASLHANAAVKAIRFAKLWDGHKTIANAVVIVDGDKVQAVSENGKVPAGAEVIDLRRFTGIPGMIDAHTHATYYWGGEPGTTPRRQPRRAVAVTVFLSQANAKKALEAGTTTIRDLNAAGGADLAMRDLINMGAMIGPRMYVSAAGLRSYKGRPGVTDPIAEAARQTKAVIDEGADWVKVFGSTGGFDNVTMEQTVSYEEMKAIVDTAHGLDHRVAIHSYGPDGARDAVRANTDSLEHATDLDAATIGELVRKKIYYVPTIDHNQYYYENADDVYKFPPEAKGNLKDYIERNYQTAKKVFEAGGADHMVVGSDAVYNGFGLNMRELTWFTKMGMSNEQALATATTIPAAMLGMEGKLGVVAPGSFADIVAVEGDPLKDINAAASAKNVRWVMKAGAVVVRKQP
jgi:imidazolonepropionase-like amidohydrolase